MHKKITKLDFVSNDKCPTCGHSITYNIVTKEGNEYVVKKFCNYCNTLYKVERVEIDASRLLRSMANFIMTYARKENWDAGEQELVLREVTRCCLKLLMIADAFFDNEAPHSEIEKLEYDEEKKRYFWKRADTKIKNFIANRVIPFWLGAYLAGVEENDTEET